MAKRIRNRKFGRKKEKKEKQERQEPASPPQFSLPKTGLQAQDPPSFALPEEGLQPQEKVEFVLPKRGLRVLPTHTRVELSDEESIEWNHPENYTEEQREDPTLDLLARAWGRVDYIKYMDDHPWWKGAFDPEDWILPPHKKKVVPLEGGEPVWKTFSGVRGKPIDKDLDFYAGKPTHYDTNSRLSTPRARSIQTDPWTGLAILSTASWRNDEAQMEAYKVRFGKRVEGTNQTAIEKDKETATLYLSELKPLIDAEIAVRDEVSDAIDVVLTKYGGGKAPETEEEQNAAIKEAMSKGSYSEKALLYHGHHYLKYVGSNLQPHIDNFDYGNKLLQAIDKTLWGYKREVKARKLVGNIVQKSDAALFDARMAFMMRGGSIGKARVTGERDEQGYFIKEPIDRFRTFVDKEKLDPADVPNRYRKDIVARDAEFEQAPIYKHLEHTRALPGSADEYRYADPMHKQFAFGDNLIDIEAYSERAQEIGEGISPEVARNKQQRKHAEAVVSAFELKVGEHFQETTATDEQIRKHALGWAREVVFYQDIKSYSNSKIYRDYGAIADAAGIVGDDQLEVLFAQLNTKLVPTAAAGNKPVFDYVGTLELVEIHQRDVIAQYFGYERFNHIPSDLSVEDLNRAMYNKNPFGAVDKKFGNLQYAVDGRRVGRPPSQDKDATEYINSLALQEAKRVIRKDLAGARGMVFVDPETDEERAQKAVASGVPFLYNMFVPKGSATTLKGEDLGNGEYDLSRSFEGGYAVGDHLMMQLNGFVAYGTATAVELHKQGVWDDTSRFVLDDRGDINWTGLLGHQEHIHAVRKDETLEEIARYYWGSSTAPGAAIWLSTTRYDLGLEKDEQPPVGTELEIHRSIFGVANKAALIARGLSATGEPTDIWAAMSRDSHKMATEHAIELADWGGANAVFGDSIDIETQKKILGVGAMVAGPSVDVLAWDPITSSFGAAGKGIQGWKHLALARQQKKTIQTLRSASDPSMTYDQLIETIADISPGVDNYFEMRLAVGLGVDENVSTQLKVMEKQLERERLVLKQTEEELPELKTEAERLKAQSRLDDTRERVARLEIEKAHAQKNALESQLEALKNVGAQDALKKFIKDQEAANLAEADLAVARTNLENFTDGPQWRGYQAGVDKHKKAIEDARDNLAAAQSNLQEAKAARNAKVEQIDVQIAELEAQIPKRKRAEKGHLEAARDRRLAQLESEKNAAIAKLKNPGPLGPKQGKAGTKKWGPQGETDAAYAERVDKWKQDSKIYKNRLKDIDKRYRESRKRANAAYQKQRKEIVEEIKGLRADRRSIKLSVGAEAAGSVRPTHRTAVLRQYTENIRAAEKQNTAATAASKKALEEAKEYHKKARGGKVKGKRVEVKGKVLKEGSIVEQHKRLVREVNRQTAAHQKLSGSAWARLAAFAPGLKMGVQSTKDAAEILENNVARINQSLLDVDNAAAEAKKAYSNSLQARKTAGLSAKEADAAARRVVTNLDKQARLAGRISGKEEAIDGWRTLALTLANEISAGNKLLKMFPDETVKFVDLLASSTKSIDKDAGSRVIDPSLLRDSLDKKFGRNAVDHFLKAEPEYSSKLKEVLESPGEVNVSAGDVFELQFLQEGLLRAREAVHPHGEAIATVRALANAKGDIDMLRVALASTSLTKTPGKFILGILGLRPDYWRVKYLAYERAMNPIKARIGATTEDMEQLMKSADHRGAMLNEDFRLMNRAAHGSYEIMQPKTIDVFGNEITVGVKTSGHGILGAVAAVHEGFSQAKKVVNSKRAVDNFFLFVDGEVSVKHLRPSRVVERIDIVRSLEEEVAALKVEREQILRDLEVEEQISPEMLVNEELEIAARDRVGAEKTMRAALEEEARIERRINNLLTKINAEANALDLEAIKLEESAWDNYSIAQKNKALSVYHHMQAAEELRATGDLKNANRRTLDAAEASEQFTPERIAQARTRLDDADIFDLFPYELERLETARKLVADKIEGPQNKTREAQYLRGQLEDAEHPYRQQYDTLVREKGRIVQDKEAAATQFEGAQQRLKELKAEHLPEDLQQRIAARSRLERLDEKRRNLGKQIDRLEEDIASVSESIDDVHQRIETKAEDVVKAYDDAFSQAALEGKSVEQINKDLEPLLRERDLYARYNETTGWRPNSKRDNPLVAAYEKAIYQRDSLEEILNPLHDEYVALLEEGGELLKDKKLRETGKRTTKHGALTSREKEIRQAISEKTDQIKEHSAIPTDAEVENYLRHSKETDDLRATTIDRLEAESQVALGRAEIESLPDIDILRERMLEIAIAENNLNVQKILNEAFPEIAEGASLTVADRIKQARKLSEAAREVDVWEKLRETAAKLGDATTTQYVRALEKLADADDALLLANRKADEARNALQARRERLASGEELLPLAERAYDPVVTKRNVPIKIAGRTSSSNIGREVAWDQARHHWRAVDLGGLEEAIELAAKSGHGFAASLKLNNVSESLTGLSRMWVPRGILLSDGLQGQLLLTTRKLLEDDSIFTFQAFAEELRKATLGLPIREASGAGEATLKSPLKGTREGKAADSAIVEREHSIGMGAYNVMRAALQKRLADDFARVMGGVLTPKQAAGINALMGAENGLRSIDPADWGDIIEGLNRLGTPITQAYVRPAFGASATLGDTTTQLVAAGATKGGEPIFMRKDLLDASEHIFDEATKRADRFYRTDPVQSELTAKLARGANQTYNHWKMMTTTGLILPRPGYWMNNIVGDFTQMYFTTDLRTASKVSFNTLPTVVPVLGRHFADYVSTMAHWSRNKPVLGTITNALFNPYIAKVWNRMPGAAVFKGGQTVPYETLHKWMVEDGIVDSVIQEEFLQLINRKAAGVESGMKAIYYQAGANWQEDLLLFADFAQKRQRAGLYLELLQKGYTRKEARKLTLEALYDWRHGVSNMEALLITKVSPFWRFWKNALKQSSRVFMEPLTKPDVAFNKMLRGAAPAQRVRQAMFLADKVPEMLAAEQEAQVEFALEDGKLRMAAKHLMSDFLYEYMYYKSDVLPEEDRDFFACPLDAPLGVGRDGIIPGRSLYRDPTIPFYERPRYSFTHSHTVGPKSSITESISMWSTLGLWATCMGWEARHKMEHGWGAESPFVPDFEKKFLLTPALKMTGPGSQQLLEGLAMSAGVDVPFSSLGRFQHYGGSSSLNPGEAWALSLFDVSVNREDEAIIAELVAKGVPQAVAERRVKEDPDAAPYGGSREEIVGSLLTPEAAAKGVEPIAGREGRYRSDDGLAVFMLRNMPYHLGIPNLVNRTYYQNPDWRKGVLPGMYTALQQTGGWFTRRNFSDPQSVVTHKQWKYGRALKDRADAVDQFYLEATQDKKIEEQERAWEEYEQKLEEGHSGYVFEEEEL